MLDVHNSGIIYYNVWFISVYITLSFINLCISNRNCESEHVTDVDSNSYEIAPPIADGDLLTVHNTGIIYYNVLSISVYITLSFILLLTLKSNYI